MRRAPQGTIQHPFGFNYGVGMGGVMCAPFAILLAAFNHAGSAFRVVFLIFGLALAVLGALVVRNERRYLRRRLPAARLHAMSYEIFPESL